MFKAFGDFSESDFWSLYNQSHDVPTPPLPPPNCCFNDVNQVLYITHVLQVVSLTSKDYEVAIHMKNSKRKRKEKTFSNSIFICFGTFQKKKKNFEG